MNVSTARPPLAEDKNAVRTRDLLMWAPSLAAFIPLLTPSILRIRVLPCASGMLGATQDVFSRVHIAVVPHTTCGTPPTSYTQSVDSTRTTEASTGRTAAAAVGLADDLNASARLLAFIVQLCFEHRPTRIQDGRGHPSLRKD